jgi:hypothetical protein
MLIIYWNENVMLRLGGFLSNGKPKSKSKKFINNF